MKDQITGAKLLVEALKTEDVEIVFGYQGAAVIPVFDELYNEPDIRLIVPRHEQGLVHAADGYARATGKPGVCLVTSGPGATNTITGLATAYYDSVPLICLTGQVATYMIGSDAFQEADTVNITRSISKHNYYVTKRDDLGYIIREAFHVATSGRPGPVVIDLPVDILKALGSRDYPEKIHIEGYNPVPEADKSQIEHAAKLLSEAERPLFLIGGGLQNKGASAAFKKAAEKTKIPVVSSLMGLGAFPGSHPQFLGMAGMHGTYPSNHAVSNCDILFAVGTRLSDRVTSKKSSFAPNARIIHVDIDGAEINKNIPASISITGDAEDILIKMLPYLVEADIKAWNKQIRSWQEDYNKKIRISSEAGGENSINPINLLGAVKERFPDAKIVTDVGQHQMWTAINYKFDSPRSLFTSGGMGTMGYGLPAAIGVQLALPDEKIISISGDGGFQMNLQELATAVQQELPIVIIIFNNSYLGMVRQWQQIMFDKRYSGTCLRRRKNCPQQCSSPGPDCPEYTPNFIKLAEAYGISGIQVDSIDKFKTALERTALSTDRPYLIEAIIGPEDIVLPMVLSGAPINEMKID